MSIESNDSAEIVLDEIILMGEDMTALIDGLNAARRVKLREQLVLILRRLEKLREGLASEGER